MLGHNAGATLTLHGSFSPEVVGESLQKERWDKTARKCSVLLFPKMNLTLRTFTKKGHTSLLSFSKWLVRLLCTWYVFSEPDITAASERAGPPLLLYLLSGRNTAWAGTQTPSLRVSPLSGCTCRHWTFLLRRLMAFPPEPIIRETDSLTGSPLEPLIPALPGSPWKGKEEKKKQRQKKSSY